MGWETTLFIIWAFIISIIGYILWKNEQKSVKNSRKSGKKHQKSAKKHSKSAENLQKTPKK